MQPMMSKEPERGETAGGVHPRSGSTRHCRHSSRRHPSWIAGTSINSPECSVSALPPLGARPWASSRRLVWAAHSPMTPTPKGARKRSAKTVALAASASAGSASRSRLASPAALVQPALQDNAWLAAQMAKSVRETPVNARPVKSRVRAAASLTANAAVAARRTRPAARTSGNARTSATMPTSAVSAPTANVPVGPSVPMANAA